MVISLTCLVTANHACFSLQEPESLGCLLELTWNGQNSLSLGGTTRKFLEDGDEVVFTGVCKVHTDGISSFIFSFLSHPLLFHYSYCYYRLTLAG
jgi:hypothetical protein